MPVRSFGSRSLPIASLLLLAACQAPAATPPAEVSAVQAAPASAHALSVRVSLGGYRTLAETAGYTAADITRLALALFEVPDPTGAPDDETAVHDAASAPVVRELTSPFAEPVTFTGLTPGKTYRVRAEAFGADGLISLPAHGQVVYPARGTAELAIALALKPRAVSASARGAGITLTPGRLLPSGPPALAQEAVVRTWRGPDMVPPTSVPPANLYAPDNVARDPQSGHGLRVSATGGHIYAQLVDANTQIAGPALHLSGGAEAVVGFNAARREFMVVAGNGGAVWTQRVGADGLPIGEPITAVASGFPVFPESQIAFNPLDREFLLTTRSKSVKTLRLSEDGRFLQNLSLTDSQLDLEVLCDGGSYFVVLNRHDTRFDVATHTYRIYEHACTSTYGTYVVRPAAP